MGHPNGGRGDTFLVSHPFDEAYEHVGPQGVSFLSTTGEKIFYKKKPDKRQQFENNSIYW
jgi:hypothetical protein